MHHSPLPQKTIWCVKDTDTFISWAGRELKGKKSHSLRY